MLLKVVEHQSCKSCCTHLAHALQRGHHRVVHGGTTFGLDVLDALTVDVANLRGGSRVLSFQTYGGV
jgi:hypothetical protein